MALVTMKTILAQAEQEKRGCGGFNVANMEMIMGVIRAAEETQTPVILQIAEVRLKYSPLALIGPMMLVAAEQAKVDVAVHLDHGRTLDTVRQALDMGFTSVMFDASALPFAENVAALRQVTELAAGYGATVEAELGLVGGSEDGLSDQGIRCTEPHTAGRFVEQTGVDALAIAIGNAHGDYPVSPRLAFDILEQIDAQVEVPLVLHGGSGISDRDFQRAISLGIRKINIATASFNSLIREVENYIAQAGKHSYFELNEAMIEGTYQNAKRHIGVFNTPYTAAPQD